MIAIVDYGMGNLRSVWKAFRYLGADARLTDDPRLVAEADGVVVPGVGAFRDCMANLDERDLIQPIRETIDRGKPYLGICLGLQLLFTESTEFGCSPGLDILPGSVDRFSFGGEAGRRLKVPHMGWNDLQIRKPAPHLAGILNGSYFYFVHSYYVQPRDPEVIASVTDYGGEFTSSVWKETVFACQFHPEKSQALGLRVIENFLNLT
jgi:glutamine amidotransferase